MKRLHGEYETEEQAAKIVKSLMDDGYSAYRQGRRGVSDDGGVDDGDGGGW